MCGIAGLYRGDASSDHLSNQVEAMAAELVHRGPDLGRVWLDAPASVALAHRRLSIQDLSEHGAQPMASASGRFVIVFNGEIYNFQILAKELADLGHAFNGHSDTEVLLAAIEEWGVHQAIERIQGMFAFALWDKRAQRLSLCRDRFGEKPLYYGWIDGAFAFASEMRPFLTLWKRRLSIDRTALTSYMRFGYVPAPRTIFQQIFKLPPACVLELPLAASPPSGFSPFVNAGSEIEPRKYWDATEIAATAGEGDGLYEDASLAENRLDELLQEVIGQQSVADVPLGAFLSGGIDSTVVTAVLQAQSARPVQTFTVGFTDGEFDEARFAAKIAKHLGTTHTEVTLGKRDCLDLIPSLPGVYDEPFADASQVPSYLISKIARERVTICLSGDGGDELFAGYNRYLHAERVHSSMDFLPAPMRHGLASALRRVPPRHWNRAYRVLHAMLPNRFGQQSNVGLKVQKAADIMRLDGLPDVYRHLMSFWTDPASVVIDGDEDPSLFHATEHKIDRPFVEQAMLWDQLAYLPGDNLTKVDRASMAVSLETRLPLLDQRVAEFAWRLPLDMRIRDGRSKWLLRQVLDRYVPRDLIERPKMGFSVPIGSWLRGPLRPWAESLLDRDRLAQQGFFHVQAIRSAWEDHLAERADLSNPIWTVLMFQAWLEAYEIG